MDFQHLLNDQSGTPRKLTYSFKNDGWKHAVPFEMVIFLGGGTFVTFSAWLDHFPKFSGENQTSLETTS